LIADDKSMLRLNRHRCGALGNRTGAPPATGVDLREDDVVSRVTLTSLRRALRVAALLVALLAAGCGSSNSTGSGVDPTPEKLDGSPSYEFEQDDLDAAEGASEAVKDYCADAVSEAQRLGCEAHVTEDEIP
jgi:hypothetical protein